MTKIFFKAAFTPAYQRQDVCPMTVCTHPVMKIFYSSNKHGRRVNNTNIIKRTQLQSRQKHLKLDSNLDTRLAHNTLGKAKPKYS